MENFKEVWRPVVGYEGLYEVSNTGKVEIVNYRNLGRRKQKKHEISNKGYANVVLSKDGQRKKTGIHRLVAMAFIPNPQNLPIINHKDENKLNNFVYVNEDGSIDFEKSNLEWCTLAYNTTYGTAIFRSSENRKKAVYKMDLEGNILFKFDSLKEAIASMNVKTPANIDGVCLGLRDTAYGFRWRWVDDILYSKAEQVRKKRFNNKKIEYD